MDNKRRAQQKKEEEEINREKEKNLIVSHNVNSSSFA
jgi:hypothetical protein